MGRPSNREQRRAEILLALERVLAEHGLGGASVTAIAYEADLAPGLIHHHFADREELFAELVRTLSERFRSAAGAAGTGNLYQRVDAALALQGPRGVRAARAWVGLFAEAVRAPTVRDAVGQVIDTEFRMIRRQLERAGVDEAGMIAAGVISLVLGSLVFGAFSPRRAQGFAAPFARRVLDWIFRDLVEPIGIEPTTS